jgi:Gas vesicle synthesis protein GvpL/GvpF
MSEQTQGTYVYGVVRSGTKLGDIGRGDGEIPEVRLVENGELAAIVSPAGGEDEAAVRDSVMAHARVLATAIEQSPVAPMRFGMVFPDDDSVRKDLLDARHDELASLLEQLEGHVQMTLKVNYREDAVLTDIVAGDPEIARLREATRGSSDEAASYNDRVRLGEQVYTAIEQRRQSDANEIMARLAPLAVNSLVDQLEKDYMVVNAPFLVERARLQEFEETVEELARERMELMSFRLLGPMPAYHFVS